MTESIEQEKRLSAPPVTEEGAAVVASAVQADGIRLTPTHTSAASDVETAISLREVDPVSVRLERLSVAVDESPSVLGKLFQKRKNAQVGGHSKKILDDISAECKSGTLTAIIGGSGSGKTSLLNQMSGRMKGNRLSISGRTLFNGSEDTTQIQSGFVIQQDILLPTLTVRETLTYAAQLRLPSSIGQEERKKLVEEVIMELSLKEAADTRIGNHEHRGCSGGEKRRVSIGVQVGTHRKLGTEILTTDAAVVQS
jgi:ABC-type lipoprotein export system ATPase subunit